MNHLTRKIAALAAALMMSIGFVAMSAPAQADTSWGYRSVR